MGSPQETGKCTGPGYVTDPKTGETTWNGPASAEVAYWRDRYLALAKLLAPYRAWLAMREENARVRFWHTPEKKEKS